MKNLILILTLSFAFAAQAYAQEHVGHGRQQQQQQSQDPEPSYEPYVIRGQAAETEFKNLVAAGNKIADMTSYCTEPVKIVQSGRGVPVCFDRGEGFRASRYKCYMEDTSVRVSPVRIAFFNLTHNDCGGNGIRIRRQQ